MKHNTFCGNRVLICILSAVLLCSVVLSGCGSSKAESSASSAPELKPVPVITSALREILEKNEESGSAASSGKAAVTADDLVGKWEDSYSQRAHMEIVKNSGNGYYYCEIRWGSSWKETAVWKLYISPQDGATEYPYDSCMLVNEIVEDDGTVREEIQYRFGTGKLIWKDGNLLWEDDQENAGEGCVFIKQ